MNNNTQTSPLSSIFSRLLAVEGIEKTHLLEAFNSLVVEGKDAEVSFRIFPKKLGEEAFFHVIDDTEEVHELREVVIQPSSSEEGGYEVVWGAYKPHHQFSGWDQTPLWEYTHTVPTETARSVKAALTV